MDEMVDVLSALYPIIRIVGGRRDTAFRSEESGVFLAKSPRPTSIKQGLSALACASPSV